MEDLEVTFDDLRTIRLLIVQLLEQNPIHPSQLTAIGSLYDKIADYMDSASTEDTNIE